MPAQLIPNRRALERTVAKLEGGSAAYVFTSGMAAIDSVFRLLRPGDHAIISEAVYGGVIRLTPSSWSNGDSSSASWIRPRPRRSSAPSSRIQR